MQQDTRPRFDAARLLPVIAATVAVLCYLPGIAGDYIFDSVPWLQRNDVLARVTPGFASLYEAAYSSESGPFGRPLSMLSFALEALAFGGMHPAVSNALNIVLHVLSAGLVLAIVDLLVVRSSVREWSGIAGTTRRLLPLAVAGLWLLHPLHVSTVLYAVQRMTILAAAGVLAGIYGYLRLRCRWLDAPVPPREGVRALVIVLAATLGASLAKENGLLLPAFIVLIELFCFRCVIDGAVRPRLRLACIGLLLLPVAVIAAAFLVGGDWLRDWYAPRDFDAAERLLTQARLLWHYLHWIVVPDLDTLGFYHDDIPLSRSLLEPFTTLLAVGAWGVVAVVAWLLRRRLPVLGFGIGWFCVAHLMESTLIPLELVFEHRNYLASIGPLLIVVSLVAAVLERVREGLAGILFLLAGCCAALLLVIRAQYWGDELQLAAYHLHNHPQSERSIFHYANVNLRRGESASDEAVRRRHILIAREQYEALLRHAPASIVALVGLLYIDASWFPDLPDRALWMERIGSALERSHADASDQNAIGMLVDCANSGVCAREAAAVPRLIERALAARCCRAALLEVQAARYYLGAGADPQAALLHARRAMALRPAFHPAYLVAVEAQVKMGLHADALGTIGEWMRNDPGDRRLATMVALIK